MTSTSTSTGTGTGTGTVFAATDYSVEADAARRTAFDIVTTVDWVHGTLLPIYVRPFGRAGIRWCAQWTAHPEAFARMRACYLAWVELSPPPGPGLSTWHRDHLDPMLRELLAETGPFALCEIGLGGEPDVHQDLPAYPFTPVQFRPTNTDTDTVSEGAPA